MSDPTRVRFAHAAAATWGVRLVNHAVSVVVSILIARALGPEGRGQYYFPVLVAATLFSVLHLGAEHAHIFLVGQGRSLAALAANAGVLAAGAGVVGIALGVAGWLWLRDSLMSGIPLGLLVLALAPLPLSLHHLYVAGLLVLRGEVIRVQQINLWGAAFQALAIGSLFAAGWVTVAAVVAINGAVTVVTWALALRLFAAATPLRLGWDRSLLAATLRFGLQMHLGLVLSIRNLRPDSFLVKHFFGLRELGYYSLAVSLVELVWLAADSIAFVVLPHQTLAHPRDAAALTMRTCRVNLIVALVLSAGLAAAAYPLVRVAYGAEFLPALPALWLLLPGIVLAAVWRPLGGFLVKLGRPLALSATSGLGLLVSLGGCLLLVPRWGIAGAAVATSAAYGALAVICLAWFLRRSGSAPGELLWIRAEGAGMWRFLRRDLLGAGKP
jgi:O-antigen/teichoic acid export membrane protein